VDTFLELWVFHGTLIGDAVAIIGKYYQACHSIDRQGCYQVSLESEVGKRWMIRFRLIEEQFLPGDIEQ